MEETHMEETHDAIGLTSMVHVLDPRAYDAFVAGTRIFDVSPDASLLENFARENTAEFGDSIVRNEDGSFRWIDIPNGPRAWLTYHKHAAQEAATPDLQQIEGP
jgi:hypothetical protein